MHSITKQKLESFAYLNNWSASHPLDMERFWGFVIEAYNNGETSLSEEEIDNVIKPIHELNEDELSKWFIMYENGIELLRVFNKG